MNTTAIFENEIEESVSYPGAYLANIREQRGYSQDFVASRLHLRTQVIDHLEADDYSSLPESVFVKGYIRAYANLLEIDSEPLLNSFKQQQQADEKKPEKALWQSRREPNKSLRLIQWLTLLFAFIVLVSLGIWWQKNKDMNLIYAQKNNSKLDLHSRTEPLHVADLSRMQSFVKPAFQDKRKDKLDG